MSSLFNSFNFSSLSQNRLNFFWRIEEVQCFYFINILRFLKIESFIDIGANIGAYTLLASTVNNVDYIYSFEPTPLTFNELISNTSFINNKKLYNLALSDTKGTCLFADFGNSSGKNGIINSLLHNSDAANKIKVNTDLLDNILQFRNSNIFIKIDVEGNELNVLKGGLNFITKNNSIIQIELGHKNQDMALNLLLNNGFKNILQLGPDFYFINYHIDIEQLYTILTLSLNELISYRWTS